MSRKENTWSSLPVAGEKFFPVEMVTAEWEQASFLEPVSLFFNNFESILLLSTFSLSSG